MKLQHTFLSITNLLIFIALLFTGSVRAEDYKEGVHYKLLANPVEMRAGELQVTEFFWYGCPHCYDLEPFVEHWLESKPEDVDFVRVPAALNPNWATHAKLYYAAEAIGELNKIHKPLFEALHKEKKRIYSESAILDFVEEQGVNPDEIKKGMNSFIVDGKMRRANQLAGRFRLSGVPAVVVNNKYMITAGTAGGNANVVKVVDYLVAKERAAQQ